VRKSVYINADLSPAESKLAYEKRQKRRERLALQQAKAMTALEPTDEVATLNDANIPTEQQHSTKKVNNAVADDQEITLKKTVQVFDDSRDLLGDTVDIPNNNPFH